VSRDAVTIPLAVADVAIRPCCLLFLDGTVGAGWHSLMPIWDELLRTRANQQVRYRSGAPMQWHLLPDDRVDVPALFDRVDAGAGCRRLELTVGEGANVVVFELTELLPVLGVERASHVRIRFPKQTAPLEIVRLAESAIRNVPLHWGSAGLAFFHVSGPRHIAYRQIAALAKRYWAVQIQDTSTLQWEALRGMPGVNWLTLIGNDFAMSQGMSLDAIESAAAALVRHGVHCRRGARGLALAAGNAPSPGDINMGDDLSGSACIAELLRPILLRDHIPLAGPFAQREALSAWLQRFEYPENWLAFDILRASGPAT